MSKCVAGCRFSSTGLLKKSAQKSLPTQRSTTMLGQSIITEGADDRAYGPKPPRLHPVPVHYQVAAGFHRPQPPFDSDDEQLDFAKLVEPLEDCYCPDFGRPAIHPEVMVRALLICSLYNIASFRRLCSAISENLTYRWFCFLTIDDPVFDHSIISHFIDRIGRDSFATIFDGLNDELLRWGMLSPEMYVDASLVKANVSGYGLQPSGMTVAEFKEQAVEENGLFVLTTTTVDDDGVEQENVRYFQSPEGRLPLNPVDTDARWKTTRARQASGLQYQENVIVDLGGFILSRGVTHASERESKAVPDLLERLPLTPVSLAGDTGYSEGSLRELLEERNITAYIPIHTKQENSMVAKGDFVYHGDHLVCPQGKVLRRSAFQHGLAPTSTWLGLEIVSPVPSRRAASRRGRNDASSP